MNDECERCGDPAYEFCSKQIGYPICEECYDELRIEACGYEDIYNWQYEED
jgi:formylmethanofuran dehydrogenase subunit E|tara:strand:+ start:317 stop:469 length:153 start_codon:yes stop_codon:yes gene_type:complete